MRSMLPVRQLDFNSHDSSIVSMELKAMSILRGYGNIDKI